MSEQAKKSANNITLPPLTQGNHTVRAKSLLTFPCRFPIKIMGANAQGFSQAIAELVKMHDPQFDEFSIEYRESKSGNYMGLTVTVNAQSQEQLDQIYHALTSHPMVKVVL